MVIHQSLSARPTTAIASCDDACCRAALINYVGTLTEHEGLAGRQELDAFGVLQGSALNGGKSGASTQPQWYSSNGVWVGVRHLDRAVEPEVPLAVGEVEQHGIQGRHAQMMFGDEP